MIRITAINIFKLIAVNDDRYKLDDRHHHFEVHRDDWFPGVVTELARQLQEALQGIEDCTKHCNALKIVPNIAMH